MYVCIYTYTHTYMHTYITTIFDYTSQIFSVPYKKRDRLVMRIPYYHMRMHIGQKVGGSHLSNTTCLTQVVFRFGE